MVFGNEIEEMFFCYCLPIVSHMSQCCLNLNSIIDKKCENKSNNTQHFLSAISLQTSINIANDYNYHDALS